MPCQIIFAVQKMIIELSFLKKKASKSCISLILITHYLCSLYKMTETLYVSRFTLKL